MMAALRSFLLACGVIGLGGAASASAGDRPATPEGVEFFEARIRPVLVERCVQCHGGGPKGAKGGLRLGVCICSLAGTGWHWMQACSAGPWK